MSSPDNYELVSKIISSPEAERMRQMVTDGFYDRSRIGLWMFEVIGREYDSMAELSASLRYEAFPQTCTWSIDIWEFICDLEKPPNLPDDEMLALQIRRARLMAKRWERPPVNPARTEAILSALTGANVVVTENVALNTFQVDINAIGGPESIFDYHGAVTTLRNIKQSHLSFIIYNTVTTEFDFTIRVAGVAFFSGIMTTRLPQYAPHVDYDQDVHVLAPFRHSINQTELKPFAYARPAYIKTDTHGVRKGKLKLANGDIVDMELMF